MTRQLLTHDDVVKILGVVDEGMIADLVATGATLAELVVALEQARSESTAIQPPIGGRVAALCQILGRWRETEPEYLGTD